MTIWSNRPPDSACNCGGQATYFPLPCFRTTPWPGPQVYHSLRLCSLYSCSSIMLPRIPSISSLEYLRKSPSGYIDECVRLGSLREVPLLTSPLEVWSLAPFDCAASFVAHWNLKDDLKRLILRSRDIWYTELLNNPQRKVGR
jgi:hypothetical protein